MAKLHQLLQLQLSNRGSIPSIQPFHSLIYPFGLQEMLAIARRYAQKAKMNVALCDVVYKYRAKPKSVRLKIGYVSSDFNNHPVSHLMKSVFRLHNSTKFEIFCYALTKSDESQYRVDIERDAEHFVDISHLHASDAATQINNDGIHILVNLNGYTKNSRNEIFALKPAPIQVSGLFPLFFMVS